MWKLCVPMLVEIGITDFQGFAHPNGEMVQKCGRRVVEEVAHFRGLGILGVSVFLISHYGALCYDASLSR